MIPLRRLAEAGHAHAIVNEITRDPDPAPTHEYERDPHSGAGNCRCGGAERDRRHPHRFVAAAVNPAVCTCALPATARCHRSPTPDDTHDPATCPDGHEELEGWRW